MVFWLKPLIVVNFKSKSSNWLCSSKGLWPSGQCFFMNSKKSWVQIQTFEVSAFTYLTFLYNIIQVLSIHNLLYFYTILFLEIVYIIIYFVYIIHIWEPKLKDHLINFVGIKFGPMWYLVDFQNVSFHPKWEPLVFYWKIKHINNLTTGGLMILYQH